MLRDINLIEELIRHIKEAGSYVLASPEDADFYRKTYTERNAQMDRWATVKPLPKLQTIPSSPTPLPVQKLLSPETPLAPPPQKPHTNPSPLRNILSLVAPGLQVLNDIPRDEMALKISERWRTKNQSAPLSILLFQEPLEQRSFLEQIARALDIYFGPAKTVQAEKIEKEKQWGTFLSVESLKMVVVCDYTLWQLNHLMEYYKEVPASGIRTLGKVPLFLLPDLALYLKDPLLKRSLWNALSQKCQHL
ncbi:MAG: hypothetical protein A3D96_00310 [Chlamydiae bacterium RIFCSPHIGHO2_12_FULL_44_59]|nr:MAG: hypothetical protein A2796_07455 [Chlamydiae bacterium RIFCSPHIGHO2_01_FULL_44_39]OGN60825.1 MAG: hypothetical protein A3D96_00310 [Chlamydiae bacterium RIFCSPHIGHO2_12_FULL_44_59]OGN66701.1 MAG: hypothetical protein A2978_02945 [Chlamydiae bacterium RIFCSPLOWO2_01_FULL_44_52]OGN67351.1 MAG: hypothetical protein A3I67_06140 [Chlamydiae bacterium RIFCSPLOWO2_02_FULL_45_22]OGN70626.1 MAG: hypothetical protein A3F79_07055 [Chlamydiae bacterium RIFCSPLOWO2_12_FULL_45_20]